MKVTAKKLPKSTIQLQITVPQNKVKQTYEEVFAEVVKNAEIKGFRKGQAPANLVKEKADVNKINGDVINKLLQKYYSQAVKEQKIIPISNPKVEIKEYDLEKDFEFEVKVATRPEIKHKEYKKDLKKFYENKIKEEKKRLKEENKEEEPHVHLNPNDVLNIVSKKFDFEVPELIVEEEVKRMKARLINQTQNVGMDLNEYLKAQNKTQESLDEEYTKIAEENVKYEFVLSELVKLEKIDVTEEEIDQMVKASGEPEPEKFLENPMNKMYVKTILEKNKVISELIKEIEGENYHEHHEH
jgi:FKBP-type peptidyl-prolyl cis-trans isomerase (trigger factor)